MMNPERINSQSQGAIQNDCPHLHHRHVLLKFVRVHSKSFINIWWFSTIITSLHALRTILDDFWEMHCRHSDPRTQMLRHFRVVGAHSVVPEWNSLQCTGFPTESRGFLDRISKMFGFESRADAFRVICIYFTNMTNSTKDSLHSIYAI
jgi:hypothetical protein